MKEVGYPSYEVAMVGLDLTEMKLFLHQNSVSEDLPCEFLLSDDEPKSALINKYAHKAKMDLILIGSRGRTKSSAILIGSIVEKVLSMDSDIPMLVVKQKGENMGFFEALMKL